MSKALLQVLVLDDDPKRPSDWARTLNGILGAHVNVTAFDLESAKKVIENCDKRRLAARSGVNPFREKSLPCELDSFDILVVDYDLQDFLSAGQLSTGLQVAKLARAFSTVKLAVLVNQFGTNRFDLTLTKSAESYADVDVGSDQLLNPALWDRRKVKGFNPWHWNDGLLGAVHRYQSAIDWISSRLDEPILEALGFKTEMDAHGAITRDLWEKLITDPKESFRDLVKNSEFLTASDRQAILGVNDSCARVVTAFVLHWLERWVIPSNEILIDLPHLVSLYPWLLRDRTAEACWQQSASLQQGLNAVLDPVKKHSFALDVLMPRPVVWKHAVIADKDLAEPKGFTYDGFPDLVFCEDTSSFLPFENAKGFPSSLPGSDPQRFVANPDKVAECVGTEFGINHVSYEPAVYFAL